MIELLNLVRQVKAISSSRSYLWINTRKVNLAQTDTLISRGQLKVEKNKLKLSRMTDRMSKYHVLDLIYRIEQGLDPKYYLKQWYSNSIFPVLCLFNLI
jgi:hypothetical protein